LLCYLKDSTPDFDAYMAQLICSEDWQILIVGLSRAKIAQLRAAHARLGSHIHISEQALDFSKAIPRANVFLTNGGIHSLSYALNHFKNCLLVPSQAEQASVALLLKEHALVATVGEASHLKTHLRRLKRIGFENVANLPERMVDAEHTLLTLIEKLAC
jgi:hypothetical protein